MIKQGREPVTPLQLLYKEWVQPELDNMDITDWVIVNMERVQSVRHKAIVNYREVAEKRKKTLDKAVERTFQVNDKWYYKTPGRDTKLSESWKGPYVVSKVLGLLTYQLDVGGRRRNIAHVRYLKQFVEKKVIRQVTTVLEDDSEDDVVQVTNGKVKLTGDVVANTKLKDMADWERDFQDIIDGGARSDKDG